MTASEANKRTLDGLMNIIMESIDASCQKGFMTAHIKANSLCCFKLFKDADNILKKLGYTCEWYGYNGEHLDLNLPNCSIPDLLDISWQNE